MDVDWSTLFKSLYADVRLRISCKDASKIPPERVVEMNQELYLLRLKVEQIAGDGGSNPGPGGGGDIGQSSQNNMDMDNGAPGNAIPPQQNANPTVPLNPSGVSSVGADGRRSGHASGHVFGNELVVDPTSLLARLDKDVEVSMDARDVMSPMHEMGEVPDCSISGGKSKNLEYCSQLLQGLDDDFDEDHQSMDDDDRQMECLDPVPCDKIGSTKRSLLPFLDEMYAQKMNSPLLVPPPSAKSKWGPTVATRRGSRKYGGVHVLTKAEEYLKKKNLEIPPYFKGNSFTILSPDVLIGMAETVGLSLGKTHADKLVHVQKLCDKELSLNHNFALDNPEVVLPSSEDLCSPNFSNSACDLSPGKSYDNYSDQLPDLESGYPDSSWTAINTRNSKINPHDRSFFEH